MTGLVFAAPFLWSAGALVPGDVARSTLPPVTIAASEDAASYRGRARRQDAVATLAWIPRILLYPAYFFSEIVVRQPLRGLAAWVDEAHVVPIVEQALHPTSHLTWWPVVNIAAPYYFAVGVGGQARDVVVRGHDVEASVAVGNGALHFDLEDSWRRGPVRVGAHAQFFTRRDFGFYGLGPDSGDVRLHFGETAASATAFVEARAKRHFRVRLAETYRDQRTEPGVTPSLDSVFAPSAVPAFGQELYLSLSSLEVQLDSRRSPDDATGARLVASGVYGRDFGDRERSFVRADVNAEAAVEVDHDRVLSIRGYLADSAPLGAEPVPFTEMPMLGWRNHVGFSWGRFRDEAAVLVEARYRYPITYAVDMVWIASAGNVFARDFHDFSLGELTASFGVGLRTRGLGRRPIEFVVGTGTTRFDQDFGLQDFQVLFSTTEGLL